MNTTDITGDPMQIILESSAESCSEAEICFVVQQYMKTFFDHQPDLKDLLKQVTETPQTDLLNTECAICLEGGKPLPYLYVFIRQTICTDCADNMNREYRGDYERGKVQYIGG